MPSTFLGLNTSYRGLVASNSGLNTTANNISNIETSGYSRQKVNQVASSAIRTYTTYGCIGTGVDTLAAERVRDVFYDIKYWNNNSKLGEYDKKQYYAAIVESYLNDTKGTNAVKGFTSIFDEYEAAMESLGTNTGDSSYALDFIGKAGNLCEYFNLLYNNFKSMQTDVNDEIKIKVDEINGIAQEIATLNKEINTIEMDGVSVANELRDKRDLLVDELSAIVDVSVEEKDIIDARTGEASGVTSFSVKIAGGQTLVDCYDYRVLKCVPRDTYQQVNANDAEGLYDVKWTDTGDDLGVHAKSTQGELKGLFEMRDGNNGEAFNGRVSKVDPDNQTVSVKVTDSYLLDMCKSTLPLTNGKITLSGKEYYYKEWSFQLSEDGKSATYTFQLDEEKNTLNNAEPISTSLTHEKAKIGELVNYQGIPYYMEQMNEWVRNYAESFNKLYGVKGATDYRGDDRTGAIFYTGTNTVNGEQYKMKVGSGTKSYSSSDDGYFRLNAGNFNVEKSIENDANSMATHTVETGGISKYDIIAELKDLSTNTDKMTFRGCKAEDFLICLMGDAALNAESANSFQSIYSNIEKTIASNRISISGVDADEEAASMINYQNAYNLSSKMISVLCEVYDKLIQETGV